MRETVVCAEKTLGSECPLPDVVLTLHPSCRFAGRLNDGQENGDQHSDNRDHDKEFDNREGCPTLFSDDSIFSGNGHTIKIPLGVKDENTHRLPIVADAAIVRKYRQNFLVMKEQWQKQKAHKAQNHHHRQHQHQRHREQR